MRGDSARGDPQCLGDLAWARPRVIRQIRGDVLPGYPPDRGFARQRGASPAQAIALVQKPIVCRELLVQLRKP
jgi:hypothetical protein